ncbi:MAG TPA: hypothetical protein DIT67_12110 [Octadecabacter sp.]|nr:hypothetical protein [Octadecabacter sp.]
MELSFASLLEWTKLTVRNPRLASELVKDARLPLEVSVLMIVLAGVVSGISYGILIYAFDAMVAAIDTIDTTTLPSSQGPLLQGALSAVQGVIFAVALHRIGIAFGGRGNLVDLMGVTALVQVVSALLLLVVALTFAVFPVVGGLVALFTTVVFFRSLGHAVNVGHALEDMGKTVAVILLSFLAVIVVLSVLMTIMGIGGPDVASGDLL